MKDKIINFMLIFLLTLIVVNLFNGNNSNTQTIDNTIKFTSVKSDYSVPASLGFQVKNNTANDFSFNTCSDILIKKDSKNITLDQSCKDITLKSKETKKIDLSNDYQKLFEVGSYQAILKKDNVEVYSNFEISHKGLISKLFVFVFYAPIYNLMAFLLEISNYSLGLAIILVTILIRLVLLWPQQKMMISQKKMQLIQPKVKEIQEKYKGDQQKLGMELMNLYKQEGVNPMGSCGMLLIQMPILIVIYNIIVGIQSQSNNYYLYSFLGDYKVSDINSVFFGINLFDAGGLKGIVLALTIAILQFIQIKLSLTFNANKQTTPKVIEKKKDGNGYEGLMPDPELMNKFMLYGMPVMIGFATYSIFAGVGLYWGIGTIFMIVQQIVVNKILKK